MTYPDKMQALIEVAQDLATAIAKNYAGIPDLILNLGNDLNNALTDYSTRTGIDVADVMAKLSAGTHVVVPVEPDAPMLQTADDVLKIIYQDNHQRSDVLFMWMKVHRAVTRAMIAAATDKPPSPPQDNVVG